MFVNHGAVRTSSNERTHVLCPSMEVVPGHREKPACRTVYGPRHHLASPFPALSLSASNFHSAVAQPIRLVAQLSRLHALPRVGHLRRELERGGGHAGRVLRVGFDAHVDGGVGRGRHAQATVVGATPVGGVQGGVIEGMAAEVAAPVDGGVGGFAGGADGLGAGGVGAGVEGRGAGRLHLVAALAGLLLALGEVGVVEAV